MPGRDYGRAFFVILRRPDELFASKFVLEKNSLPNQLLEFKPQKSQ